MKDEGWKMKDKGSKMKDQRWKMKDERWRMKDKGWKMKDEGWWFQAVEGFCFMTDERTDRQTFAIVESLLRLKT